MSQKKSGAYKDPSISNMFEHPETTEDGSNTIGIRTPPSTRKFKV